MKLTMSVRKADAGSIGGHTKPSEAMMQTVRSEIQGAVNRGLIIGGFRDAVTDLVNQFTFRDSARTNGKARASKRADSRGK